MAPARHRDEVESVFCENYMVIKPEHATFFDLLRILLRPKCLESRAFINTSGPAHIPHRWMVFVNVLLQKVFLLLDWPMAMTGSVVELLLNLPAANGGHRRLFWNLLTGRLVIPNKSSESFASMCGNLDKRLDLDKSVSSKYKPSLAMMASKLSYENQSFVRNVITNNWQMEFMESFNFWNDYQQLDSTNAIMFKDNTFNPNLIIVAFRGTEAFTAADWRTDLDISWYEFPGIGKIHGGFMKALGLQRFAGWSKEIHPVPGTKPSAYYTICDKLRAQTGNTKFLLTGHSLGGALAILFAAVLAMHEEELLLDRLEGVYTFGQPRVGNDQFGEYMNEKMREYNIRYFRFVYGNDMVPSLPYDDRTHTFKHFGPCLHFNSSYKAKVLEEEPNKNYFSVLHVLPKMLTAVYQLIRGFVLPWMEGEAYKEGWLMTVFRVIALVFPGLTDHVLVDYVNLTRLGNVPSLVHHLEPNRNASRSMTGETSTQPTNEEEEAD